MMPGPPPVMMAKPCLGERGGQAPRGAVVAVSAADARGAEDRDRRADIGQGVEALDELAHDAQDPPGIGLLEAGRRLARAKELLVLGARCSRRRVAHDDRAATALGLLLPTGHGYLSRSTVRDSDATVAVRRHDICFALTVPVGPRTG